MINKRKRIRKFLQFLQNRPEFAGKPVPETLIVWTHPAIMTKTGVGFGVMLYDPIEPDGTIPKAYIAVAGKLSKQSVMECLGHEYAHYYRFINGLLDESQPEIEEQFAEQTAEFFMNMHEQTVSNKRKRESRRRARLKGGICDEG